MSQTIDQIKSVIKIAAEVPGKDVIAHIEGGRAGGHHSWEDLDDLLLATYADLRKLSNITICVGGGIGTPERAADYLAGKIRSGGSGVWGAIPMPPQPQLDDEQVKTLVRWLLDGAPE